MKKQFKTFVTKDRTEFAGVDHTGEIVTSSGPIHILNPDCTLDECKKAFNIGGHADDRLFTDYDLVLFEMREVV